jgi:hypothetical protein
MANLAKSFPGTLKNVAWGKPYEVFFEGEKKSQTIVSGLTGSAKEFVKDYERITERKITKITQVLTEDELAEAKAALEKE